MSHNKPSRLRFAINLGNAVWPISGRQESQRASPSSSAIGWRRAGASAPNSFPILPRVKWWLTPVASTGILPFWPSIRRGSHPALYLALYHHPGTALVSVDSPCQSVADMDRPATTINVGQNAAYDLWLTRHLQHASLHRLPSSQEAIDAFLAGEGDMVAGIRQPLEATARQHAGVRVLADNFTEIQQAICVARADVDRFHAVNDALSEWRADGSLLALIAGHWAKRTESRLRHPAHGAMPRRCVPRRAVRGPRHAPSGASCAAAAA